MSCKYAYVRPESVFGIILSVSVSLRLYRGWNTCIRYLSVWKMEVLHLRSSDGQYILVSEHKSSKRPDDAQLQ